MVDHIDRAPEAHDLEPGEMNETEIDEALKGSFPASDPPPWTLGLDPHPHPADEDSNDVKDDAARSARNGE